MSSVRSRSGGSVDGDHVQPGEQILAKQALLDRLLEIAVRRRDEPHVDAQRLDAADALERALLQDAQQLHLHVDRQLAYLVEEQRSAVRQLEAPRLLRHGTGKRALLVPEQLGLEWSALFKRVFALDVLPCPRCGARRRIVAVYTGGELLRVLLERLGFSNPSAATGPSRSPPGSAAWS